MADIVQSNKKLGEMALVVKELDAMGMSTNYAVDFPQSLEYDSLTIEQKMWMLKVGAASKCSLPMIFCLIVKTNELSKRHNVPLEPGVDVFPTGEGRFGITNTAQIKIAQATGLIEGYTFKYDEGEDLACTVTLHVKNLKQPIVLTQYLSEWYKDGNPNWKQRPRHMLLMNTLGHACRLVTPTVEDDYAVTPSATPDGQPTELELQLAASLAATQKPTIKITGE